MNHDSYEVEICVCGKHGRFVKGDREDFSSEFASVEMGHLLLSAIQDRISGTLLARLFHRIQGSGLPTSESEVDSQTKALVENWNNLYHAAESDEPTLDPKDFHAVAVQAIVKDSGNTH